MTDLSRLQVLSMLIDRLGYRRGARLGEFIAEWEVACRSHGGPVTSEEFAAWWKDSRATTYRRLADFREAFPELGPKALPSDFMRPLLERLADGQTDVDAVPLEMPT